MNKSLCLLEHLLEACARRDFRYREAYGQALRAVGPTLGELPKIPDFSEWPDDKLINETRHHLQSMLIGCVYGTGDAPDFHQRLQMIERAMPLP
ncbi:MAG: hypothetical protein ACK49N_04600 [Verrucomicrobiota bacterium]